LPHIRSITMERQQDSIIMDAATRRNLEITQNLAGGFEIRWPRCSTAP
jgi:DNA mismatch repair protein MutS